MRSVIYVNPDNVEVMKKQLALHVAVIGRFDDIMSDEANVTQVIVETLEGVHTRCYLAQFAGINFLMVYGRFDRIRQMSSEIDFRLTQQAVNFLGIKTLVGTFVVGSIQPDCIAGTTYIPHDFVGLGGYQQTMAGENGFRNVDMFQPFCSPLREALINGASKQVFLTKTKGVYACFHGYPRIETEAELAFYARNGWDVVGQTLDPEATLARESGCHYAALTATIDDSELRARFMASDATARQSIDDNIIIGRRKMWQIFSTALPDLVQLGNASCSCQGQGQHFGERSKHFYYRPKSFFD